MELKLQTVMSCLIWVQGFKFRPLEEQYTLLTISHLTSSNDLSLIPRKQNKKPKNRCGTHVILMVRWPRQEDHMGWVASCSIYLGDIQDNERPCLKRKKDVEVHSTWGSTLKMSFGFHRYGHKDTPAQQPHSPHIYTWTHTKAVWNIIAYKYISEIFVCYI